MKACVQVVLILSAALLWACSGSGETIDSVEDIQLEAAGEIAGAEVGVPVDAGQDIQVPPVDVPVLDLTPQELPAFDQQSCQPGTGCFLEPCIANTDCQTGICLLHQGEMVCSDTCVEECPFGFACKASSLFGPDTIFVCESLYPALCLPCSETGACEQLAGLGSACVDLEGEGFFCGAGCFGDSDCPPGFSCRQVATVDGLLTTQCMADDDLCPCTGYAVGKALSTTCSQENEWGVCPGSRTCGEAGLTECDAAVPDTEVCDGIDNDCNGMADDVSCDDENACTTDLCNPEEGCVNEPQTGGECLDGDSCTFGDHCEDGQCVGSVLNCDDGNPCTTELCDTELGCQYEYSAEACDDGNPCTFGDTCLAGQCVGLPGICQCEVDEDCGSAGEANLCLGTWYCDKTQSPFVCEIVPGSAVKCEPSEGTDKYCYANQCAPETGECVQTPTNQGAPCDDGDGCTMGEQCLDGLCGGSASVSCNDGNPCTDDLCEPAFGCIYLPNVDPCSDGDACTAGDHCSDQECLPGQVLNCDDGNECTTDSCDVQLGCVHIAVDQPCDDGNECTTGDQCQAGWCKAIGAVDCDDANPCTDDLCDPLSGCLHTANAAPCSDGSACTGPDQCVEGQCIAGAVLDCDDGNPCTDDSCQQETGCVNSPNESDCDDGNECTLGDQCSNGWCLFQALEDCNDDNPCTDEHCDSAVGCVANMNNAPCDDNNLCTIGDGCNLGECVGGLEMVCNDGNPCTADACKPGVGCEFTPAPGACDDGNECTVGDSCVEGKCLPESMKDCDDENLCTANSCDPLEGCQNPPVDGFCSDDDACTVGDSCLNGECQPGGPRDCDDDNVCTEDSCDPDLLCTNTPIGGDCDDDDLCTLVDECVDGQCVGSSPLDCDLGQLCTSYLCDPEAGCLSTPVAPCCGNGATEAPEECDDGGILDGDGCSGNCTVENTAKCSNNSTSDCNPAGVTLIPSSAFVDQDPPGGWTQCAGFVNTSGNDVSANLLNNCLNTTRLRVKAWNVNGNLEEDVYDQGINLGGSIPNWAYLGSGGMEAKPKSTYWTGGTTYFTTTNGQGACGKSICPSGTPTLGTGNGDSVVIAPGNSGGDEWRINCNGQSLPGRKIAVYR